MPAVGTGVTGTAGREHDMDYQKPTIGTYGAVETTTQTFYEGSLPPFIVD